MRDADDFAALYEREAETVLLFVTRRTLDAEVALDITAETFAQAFRGRRAFRGTTEPEERAWLFTIARRQIGRYLRRGHVERGALQALGVDVPVAHEDDLRAIEEAAELAALRGALTSELERRRPARGAAPADRGGAVLRGGRADARDLRADGPRAGVARAAGPGECARRAAHRRAGMKPPILDELGRELVRAARASEGGAARDGAFARAPRAFLIGLLALLGLAAAAAAASVIIGRGDPIAPARERDVPVELRPVQASARLNGLAVADPDGGPAWDVRTSRSRTGAVCAAVGQVLDGELGLVGLDRRFRALPPGAADTCSTPQRRGAILAGARGFRGGGRLGALTVVNGVASASVRHATAIAGGRAVRMRLGPGNAFLAVFKGLPEEVRPRLVLRDAAGRETTLRFADKGEFIAADPDGGTPWALHYPRSTTGLRCVAARRERGPRPALPASVFNIIQPSLPPRCGRPARAFVAIARFVPREQTIGEAFWWGLHPARTVVWGAAPAGGGAVVLHGAGPPRRLNVDARRRGFLAILDGRVDPRALRVTAGGRAAAMPVGTNGQRFARVPVPAWRSVAAVARSLPKPPEPFAPDARGVATSRRASDPTGGPGWALRTWTSRIHQRGRGNLGLRWYTVGIERGEQLLEPRPGGGTRVIRAGEDAGCIDDRSLSRRPPPVQARTYVEDPDAPDPVATRVVVAGLLGPRARSAQLLGAGAPRPLELGRFGTFLLVLGPEHAGADLRVRQVRADGTARTSAAKNLPLDCAARAGQSIRVADPDGGQSWTTGIGRLVNVFPGVDRTPSGTPCLYTGRLAGDRVGTVVEGATWLRYGAEAFNTRLRELERLRRPLELNLQGPGFGLSRPASGALSPAQVARRTLAGRTVVSGRAGKDVVTITLTTPRDVRTVRPGPGGVFIAVYDGAFYGGEVRAVAHLRDGSSFARTAPLGGP
jgi:hypothetical protein